ncbi:hypothetical protein ACLOJK_039907 [Asimina triloba]
MGRKPCCANEGLNRGAWTSHEDKLLADCIAAHGQGRWRTLPKKAGLKRCGKSCRLRWLNYLRPDIKRGNITTEEEDLIIRLHKLLGNRWSLIAGRLPGRTDNEIKNYWNTYLRKKLSGDSLGKQQIGPKVKKTTASSSHEERMRSQVNAVQTKAERCSRSVFADPTESVSDAFVPISGGNHDSQLGLSGDERCFVTNVDGGELCAGDITSNWNSPLTDGVYDGYYMKKQSGSGDNEGYISPLSEENCRPRINLDLGIEGDYLSSLLDVDVWDFFMT